MINNPDHLEIDELARKAEAIKNSNLLDGQSKQLIFLVLAGKKPVSEFSLGKQLKNAEGEWIHKFEKPDTLEVGKLLSNLGLYYDLKRDYKYPDDGPLYYIISLQENLITKFSPKDSREEGQLYGFPKTVTEAYLEADQESLMRIDTDDNMKKQVRKRADKLLISSDEKKTIHEKEGIPESFGFFRYSRAHWQEELAVTKDWYNTLKRYGLA